MEVLARANEVSIGQGITIILIFFGIPIVIIWLIVLAIRWGKHTYQDDSSGPAGTSETTQISDGNVINWQDTSQQARKKKMPAWQILLIVIVSVAGLYYIAGILIGILGVVPGT